MYHGLFNNGFPEESEKEYWKEINLKWFVSKLSKEHKRSKKFQEFIKDININWITTHKTMKEVSRKVKKSPSQGTITIIHLLEQPIESLMVIGCDFYETGYFLGYHNFNTEEEIEKIRDRNYKGFTHDMVSQIKYLSQVWEKNSKFQTDEVLERIFKQGRE